MVSNEGRREVANWLRLSGKSLGFDNCFVQMLCDVAGTDLPPEDFDAAGYLADLIDRPTCRKRIPDEMEGLVFCSNCGAEIGEYSVPNYCHNCGAEVVK